MVLATVHKKKTRVPSDKDNANEQEKENSDEE